MSFGNDNLRMLDVRASDVRASDVRDRDDKAVRELLAAFGVQYLDDIPWQVRADWYEEHGYSELADDMRK